jgi:hypothetical protein
MAQTIRSAKSRFTIVGGVRTRVRSNSVMETPKQYTVDREQPEFAAIFRKIA